MSPLLFAVHIALGWATLSLLIALFVWRRAWRRLSRVDASLRLGLNACLVAQVVVSLILYLRYSAYTAGVRANVDVVLHDATLRYWNVLHPLVGLTAVAFALWTVNRRAPETSPGTDIVALATALVLMASALPSLFPGM